LAAVEKLKILTVSRETESLGDEIALKLAECLGLHLVDREEIQRILEDKVDNGGEELDDRKRIARWIKRVRQSVAEIALDQPVLFLGRGGQKIFEDDPQAFHLLVVTSPRVRIQRTMEKFNQDEVTASRILAEQDNQRERFLLRTLGINWRNPGLYHLVLNTTYFSVEYAVEVVEKAIVNSEQLFPLEVAPGVGEGRGLTGDTIVFNHPSEEEFARILDFYGIRWLYEPRTFPLEWDEEGNVAEAFSPDFYLPDFDLFIELTTQRQKLVWKKNKKVRRLKELYPEVRIKVMYSRDYSHLLQKFGVEDR